jgi:REP element-mobilizing transposase RayT
VILTQIVTTIKSITVKHIFLQRPEVKQLLGGVEFWSDGFSANTFSKFGAEKTISEYVKT